MIDLYDDDKKRKYSDWKTGQDVFDWWTERWKNEVKGQISLEDWIKGGGDKNDKRRT
jgi:hypothetical protein